MASWVRPLLIWLLVLALPAQGAMAVTMAFCGPSHHSGAQAAPLAAAPASRAHHDCTGASGHPHHGAVAVLDDGTSAATVDAEATDPAQVGLVSQHTCSSCASCCAAGAMPSSVLVAPTPVFARTVFRALVPSVDPFSTDGPDRPPRIVLA